MSGWLAARISGGFEGSSSSFHSMDSVGLHFWNAASQADVRKATQCRLSPEEYVKSLIPYSGTVRIASAMHGIQAYGRPSASTKQQMTYDSS